MKICFFGNISGAIEGRTIGGGELQVYLLSKALALQGHDVVIVDPYSPQNFTTAEGVKVLAVPDCNKGTKALRMFVHRLPALRKVFTEQNADYYYVRMRSYVHLLPYLVAKKIGSKFIQAIASDIDILSQQEKFKYEYKVNFRLINFLTESLPNDLIFKFLLNNADYITLQHSGQRFKSTSSKSKQVIFSNIIDLENLPAPVIEDEGYFIYVGSMTMLKGVDNLLKIINLVDESIQILIVGLPKGKRAKEVYEILGKKKNVVLKGRKDHKETLELMSKAKAVINTSYFEGFPNIYLEAWGMGVPVISLTVNPGNLFNKFNLGTWCNSDLNKMKHAIEHFNKESFKKNELIEYVEKYHDFKSAADRFCEAISPSVNTNAKTLATVS